MDHLDSVEANSLDPSTSAQPAPSTSAQQATIPQEAEQQQNQIGNAMKEIIPSPLKSPVVTKKPRQVTKPILHLTSPQSMDILRLKDSKKKPEKEKNKSKVEGKAKGKENTTVKKKNKATPGLKVKSSSQSRDWYCIFCSEKFVHPPTEDWIQCSACEEWCHENCADRGGTKGHTFVIVVPIMITDLRIKILIVCM